MLPRLERGCHCSLSLRACTITLASIQLILSLFTTIEAAYFEVYAITMTRQYAEEELPDFDYSEEPWSGSYFDGEESSSKAPEASEFHSASTSNLSNFYHWLLTTAMVFDAAFGLMALLDVVLSSILIAGAAKRRAALIRPWLYLGAAFVVVDIMYLVFHLAVGSHISVFFGTIPHIPFAAYLWIVSWSLYLDCTEEAKRHASPVSMSTLVEDCEEEGDHCSVPYATLEQ